MVPVSRAPTMRAVTTGMKARPSKVSSTCEIFSTPVSRTPVSADPVRSISVRYTALVKE